VRDLLHPLIFIVLVAAIGLAAHIGVRRSRKRFDDSRKD